MHFNGIILFINVSYVSFLLPLSFPHCFNLFLIQILKNTFQFEEGHYWKDFYWILALALHWILNRGMGAGGRGGGGVFTGSTEEYESICHSPQNRHRQIRASSTLSLPFSHLSQSLLLYHFSLLLSFPTLILSLFFAFVFILSQNMIYL